MGNLKDSSPPCWLTLGRNILCLQVQVEIDLAWEIYACKLNVAKLVHNSLQICDVAILTLAPRWQGVQSGRVWSDHVRHRPLVQVSFIFFTDCYNFIQLCISIAHHSRSDGELRAIAEDFAYDNAKFVKTVVAAWDKLTTADRWARVDYVLTFLKILSSFSRYIQCMRYLWCFQVLGPCRECVRPAWEQSSSPEQQCSPAWQHPVEPNMICICPFL